MIPFMQSAPSKPPKSVVKPTAYGGKTGFDPKFCGLLATILIEFKQLLTESHSPLVTKRKHADIKAVRDKMEAVVAWCEGVQQGTIHMALVQASMEGFEKQVTGVGTSQAAEVVDEHLTILMDAYFGIVETNKLQKIYMPIFNMLQRLLMSIPARCPTDKTQMESNEFRMSQDCRERILSLFAVITQQEQNAPQLDEMQHLKILQILMIFLDPNQSDKITKRFVNHVLKICFQLFDLKTAKSTSTSSGASTLHGGTAALGSIAIRSTLQASLRQLLCMVLDSFNQEVDKIIGDDLFKEAFRKETGQYCKVSQAFLENFEHVQNSSIFSVVEDMVQNLATALFIHEQASHDNGFGGPSLKKSTSSHSSGALIGGIMGSISNQHVWNFKPSLQTSCAVLDILSLSMEETGSLFVYFPKICKVFENQIIPTLIQMLKNLSGEASHGIRVVKSLISVLVNLSCTSQYVHEEHQLSSHSSQRSDGNNVSSQMSIPDINDSLSQKSPARPTGTGTVFRTSEFQHLDQIVMIFTQIASLDNVLAFAKDKEITSNNVHQIIAKINWKHLVGMEALAYCFQDQAVVAKLASLENGKAIVASLDSMAKVMNYIKILDHRNGFSMMSQSFSSHGSDEIINLASFSIGSSGSSTHPQPLAKSKRIHKQNLAREQDGSLFAQIKGPKILYETQQFQVEDDIGGLRLLLGPANIQQLLQECVIGLIISLTQIQRQEVDVHLEHNLDEQEKNQNTKNDSNDRMTSKVWSSSVMIDGGKVATFINAAGASQARDDQKLLVQASALINSLLEKLYYSIQKNQALFLEEKAKEEQIQQLSSSTSSASMVNQSPSSSIHPSSKQMNSQTVTVSYALHTSLVLQSIGNMVEMLQDAGLFEYRDLFVRTLCSLCTSRQVTLLKSDSSRNSSSLSAQVTAATASDGANRLSSHSCLLKIEQPMVTVGNVLACQALIALIQKKFASNDFSPEGLLGKLKKTESLRSRGQAQGGSARDAALLSKSRKAQSFIETRRAKLTLDSREPGAIVGMAAHEQDLEMWQCIIDTIVRLDSSIGTQMEETGIFTTSGKRVGGPLPSARQSTAMPGSGSQFSGASIDAANLIDFAKMAEKIQKTKSNGASTRGRLYSDGAGSSYSDEAHGVQQYSGYPTLSARKYTQAYTPRQGTKQLELPNVGAPEFSQAEQWFALQSTQGIFSSDELGQRHLNFNVTMRKVWVIDGFKSPSKIEMGTLRLAQVESLNAKNPAYSCYLPLKQDLVTLQGNLDALMVQTEKANRLTLFQFCRAFQNTIAEHVGHKQATAMSPSQAEAGELVANSVPTRLLERLMELVLINIGRIDVLWDQFVAIMSMLQQSQGQKQHVYKKLSIEAIQALIKSYFQYKKNQKQERKSMRAIERDSTKPRRQDAEESIPRQLKGDQQVQDLSPDFSDNNQESNQRGTEKEVPVTVEEQEESEGRDEDFQEKSKREFEGESDDDGSSSGEFGEQVKVLNVEEYHDAELSELEEWAGTKWQATILQPLTNVMISQSVMDKLMALKSIERIIQLCGQNMKHDGWTMIILNIGNASEIGGSALYAEESDGMYGTSDRKVTPPASSIEVQKLEQQVVQHGFKCLKLIINNYIQLLGQENFVSIFKCIQIFAQQDNENINSNLIAVGMFMNVADYNAKLKRSSQRAPSAAGVRASDLSQQKKQQQINVDFIWKHLFQRMQSISRDCKAEVRRSLIQTLENIIINYGHIICMDVWGMLLHKILLGMVKHSSDLFNRSCQRSQTAEAPFSEAEHAKNAHKIPAERTSAMELPSQGGKKDLLAPEADDENSKQQAFTTSSQPGGSQARKNLATGGATQSFQTANKRKQMVFDDESVLKALKDNDEQSWSETCIQLISSTYRAIKIYIQLLDKLRQQDGLAGDAVEGTRAGTNEYSPEKSDQEERTLHAVRLQALKKIWKEYHSILGSLINHSSQAESQMNKTTLMVLQQIFTYQEDFLQIQNEGAPSQSSQKPSHIHKCHQFFVEQFECQILLLQKIKDWIDKENSHFEGVMKTALSSVPKFVNRNKSLILKVTPDIVQYLSKIFSSMLMEAINDSETLGKKIVSPDTIGVLLELVQSLQVGCKIIGQGLNQAGKPYKPLNEELLVYKFVLQLNDVCMSGQESQRMYLDFLLETIKLKGCAHSESQVKKHLQILNSIICKAKVEAGLLYSILDTLFSRLRDLLDIRYDWAKCKSLIYSQEQTSGEPGMEEEHQNLIQFVAHQAIGLASYLLDPIRFKRRVCSQVQEQPEVGASPSGYNQLRMNDWFVSTPELIDDVTYADNTEMKKKVWSLILPIVKESLLFNIQLFDRQKTSQQPLAANEEHYFVEVVKVSQNLDMQTINFVVNELLAFCACIKQWPEQAKAMGLSSAEIEKDLMQIVDEGCQSTLLSGSLSKSQAQLGALQFFKECNFTQSKSFEQASSSLANNCLRNLLEICKFGVCEDLADLPSVGLEDNFGADGTQAHDKNEGALKSSLQGMKLKISSLTLPILINRCRDILKQFSQDEQRSGSMKLPQSRNTEVIFILKELANLSQSQQQYRASQASTHALHDSFLFDLMPVLSELIVSQSDEIREHLKTLFLHISQQVAHSNISTSSR